MLYAHSKRDLITKELLPKEEWHPLPVHLEKTAEKAAENAGYFHCDQLGRILGYAHDYGKADLNFLKRLEGSPQHVDHKTAGTLMVAQHYPYVYGRMLAYVVYGHHGGLPNHISKGSSIGLDEVLKNKSFSIINNFLPTYPTLTIESIPKRAISRNPGISFSLLIRMLYSSLVDADYLDTEKYFNPKKAELRGKFSTIKEMSEAFSATLNDLLTKPQNNILAKSRNQVLKCCLKAAQLPSGIFTLTVPTGGGKTYSSLAFALAHAQKNNMRRIIYGLPFISIIEQNAEVFRSALGKTAVLEHHSNFTAAKDDEVDINRLASENWEANLVVTTNVELFESLFAAKPSRARKLHNLAGSIIILDEAQMIPTEVLRPCLAALKCLSVDYGVTVVLCTATQPALHPDWLDGITPVEIMDDPVKLYSDLKRVSVKFIGLKSDAELSKMLSSQHQVLCIVNTRRHAQALYKSLGKQEGSYHLSALMCPEHRTEIISEIKLRLQNKQKCIVISTSLLEAGVDIDFPQVYREIAGIHSIAQAAGRCNREGLAKEGEVFIFESSNFALPRGWFTRMAGFTRRVISRYPDPLMPDAVSYFFRLCYGLDTNLDEYNILGNLNAGADQLSFQFREVAENFKFINSDTVSIIIPYNEDCKKLLTEAKNSDYPGSYSKKLQRYSVSITPSELEQIRALGKLEIIDKVIYHLVEGKEDSNKLYSSRLGLSINPDKEW
ncbi:CRISPR-associated helicase Cas3' [Paenibacillus agri]|uniref:CRISPR-associated helicase Cas3 n=1 Tax=Paenibacillus agri TaxID=2744309 RepID=A0A850EDY5_9BACL|nr:CRISPR-associated helicase Cas3' [Paenibacillus agri]NUU59405.1 CRISPR-associated helicase Cas3' [Paenibacillus agri]